MRLHVGWGQGRVGTTGEDRGEGGGEDGRGRGRGRGACTERSSDFGRFDSCGQTLRSSWHPRVTHVSRVPRVISRELPMSNPATTAVIVDAVRTPLGRRNGKLKDWHPVDLAAETLKALQRAHRHRPGHRRRRDHGLRHAGRRAGGQRRPQRRARRRLARARARHHHRPPVRLAASRPPTSRRRASSPAPTTSSSPPASR